MNVEIFKPKFVLHITVKQQAVTEDTHKPIQTQAISSPEIVPREKKQTRPKSSKVGCRPYSQRCSVNPMSLFNLCISEKNDFYQKEILTSKQITSKHFFEQRSQRNNDNASKSILPFSAYPKFAAHRPLSRELQLKKASCSIKTLPVEFSQPIKKEKKYPEERKGWKPKKLKQFMNRTFMKQLRASPPKDNISIPKLEHTFDINPNQPFQEKSSRAYGKLILTAISQPKNFPRFLYSRKSINRSNIKYF